MFQTGSTAHNVTRNRIELARPTIGECYLKTIRSGSGSAEQCLNPINAHTSCGRCAICKLILEAQDRYGINHLSWCHCERCYPPNSITAQSTQLLDSELEDHLPWCHCNQCLADDTLIAPIVEQEESDYYPTDHDPECNCFWCIW